jgi:Fe-S cluster assembly protein SufD
MSNPNQTAAHTIRQAWQSRQPADTNWVRDLQEQAMADFDRSGFPTRQLEDWKYTDVSELAAAYPQWLLNSDAAETTDYAPLLDIADALRIVVINGVYRPELSSPNLPACLIVGSLTDLAVSHPALLEDNFGQLANSADSGFIALNTAFNDTAIALIVPDNMKLDTPVYIDYRLTAAELSVQPRLIANLGANSSAAIIEHYSGDAPGICNAVAEIHCQTGAQISYCRLQEAAADAWHTAVQHIRLEKDANARTTVIDSGSGIARTELHLCLAGPGASADAKGLLLADGNRHIDSRINVNHAAPDTTSRERYRSILADKSRGVFNGRILVDSVAQKTAAELTNRNLLLNPGAEINTKPELEIYADDVKCAHGSTTGQLDTNSMFYLLSRGIPPNEARNMLVRAFASELLVDIEFPAVRERTQAALRALRFSET